MTFAKHLEDVIHNAQETVKRLMYAKGSSIKPSWLNRVEKFSVFYDMNVRENPEVLRCLEKAFLEFFETYSADFKQPIVDATDTLQDRFLRTTTTSSDKKVKRKPLGIYFEFETLYLPVSEIYMSAREVSFANEKHHLPDCYMVLKNLMCMYHSLSPSSELEKNIKILDEVLGGCDTETQPVKRKNPLENIKDMMKGMIKSMGGGDDMMDDMMNMIPQVEEAIKKGEGLDEIFKGMISKVGGPKEPEGEEEKESVEAEKESDFPES